MSDTCPNCGYCKHCGRGAQPVIPWYPQPYQYPWWQLPRPYYDITWCGDGSQTPTPTIVTCGGTSNGFTLNGNNCVPFTYTD